METKIDTLPSTESKKICSLINTDLDDSNVITKEREDELLNDDLTTCEEDIDEDEALSDDSLRLKLSDDDEAEQDDVDSSEYFYKQLKEEESDEDKKYGEQEHKFATSEEEKDSEENFNLNEKSDIYQESSIEVNSEENFNIDQNKFVTNDLNASEIISEIAHDQEAIMNGNDPRFYPNSIRPMYENRWSPSNHRMRMGFINRPPPPSHQRYYPNSNYNASDVTDNRYYNKYKHYNRVRGSGKHHSSYNFKSKTERKKEKESEASSTLKLIDCNSSVTCNDDDPKTQDEKSEDSDKAKEQVELVENDKIDDSGKINEINSTEKSENEKENINDCATSESIKTAESKEDLPNSLIEDKTDGKDASKQVTDIDVSDDNENSNHMDDEESEVITNCNLKELDNKILKEQEMECSNVENCEELNDSEKDLPKNDNEEEEEEEEAILRKIEDEFGDNESDTILPSSASICMNEDSGSTIDNLPKVYQCLEEIASMEASRIAEEKKKAAEETKKDAEDVQNDDSIKLKLSCEGDNNNENEYENKPCDKAPSNNSKDKNHDNDNESDNSNASEKSPGDDEDIISESAIAENESIKESQLDDNNANEEENSNLTMESSESVSSKNIEEKETTQDVEKMNFDDNACHPNEDSKEATDNNEVTKDSEYTNNLYDTLIAEKSDIVMEDISNDKLNDASNDVSNDIHNDVSNDINNDISNDVSDVNSNDASTDVLMKISEEDESNSQNSVVITEKIDEAREESEAIKETETNKKSETNKKLETNKQSETNKKSETNKRNETNKRTKTNKEIETNKKTKTNKEIETNKETIEEIKEIIGVQEEKMIIDDDESLNVTNSQTSNKKSQVESSKISANDSSEKLESSTSTDNTKDHANKNKEESYLRLKSQTDDTLFAPKIPTVENKEGETNVRQKRRTARNAEELIKTKFLKSDSEDESDDSGKYVSLNYKKPKLLVDVPSVSPSSLKRNLGDDDDACNERDALDNQVTVKKLKMSVESPRKQSKDSLFIFEKKDDTKGVKDLKIVKDIKDVKDVINLIDTKGQESIRNLVNVRKFFQRDMKGQLQKLKQEELEELLIQKVVETITMASEIGKLREQARLSEKNQEATRARCQQLAKQIQDFEMVLKRNAADRSSSNDKFVAPIKINRSVGLQVNFISDHGMQNMRQIQQNAKTTTLTNTNSSNLSSDVNTPQPRKGIKVRSPRRSENIPSAGPATPSTNTVSQAQIPPSPIVTPVTPAALVSAKPVPVDPPSRTLPMTLQSINAQQPVISSVNIRSPNKISTIQGIQQNQQAVILNGNLSTARVATTPLAAQKPKSNNDLIDLTDEEEKTKTAVNTPIAVTSATIISNHPRGNIIQSGGTSHYQRVIQTIPTSVALSGQTTNIRVVQPNSQTTPTALVNNINASRMYVMQSGGQPRQILIANPNSLRQNATSNNRNQFSTITYKTANGIPSSANGTLRLVTTQATVNAQIAKHPAPLPDSGPCDSNPNWKLPPPAPSLKISKVASGIVLSWNMTLSDKHAEIVSYQLFAYQEVNGTPPSTLLWKKVGDVMALPLPMACTLTQFSAGNNYYFAVRAVDSHSRLGQYSLPGNISL